jgi:ABC-type lipoprotein release transport system permease subunit
VTKKFIFHHLKKWHRPDPNHLSIAVNAARQGVEKQVKSVRIEQIAHLNVNRRKNRHKNRQRIRLHEKSQSMSEAVRYQCHQRRILARNAQ